MFQSEMRYHRNLAAARLRIARFERARAPVETVDQADTWDEYQPSEPEPVEVPMVETEPEPVEVPMVETEPEPVEPVEDSES